jgi:hypothetical protein
MHRQEDQHTEKRRQIDLGVHCADSEQKFSDSPQSAQYSVEQTGHPVPSEREVQVVAIPGHFEQETLDPRAAMAGPCPASFSVSNRLALPTNAALLNPNFAMFASVPIQPSHDCFTNFTHCHFQAPELMVAPFLVPQAMSSWVRGQPNWNASPPALTQWVVQRSAAEAAAAAASAASNGLGSLPMQPSSSCIYHTQLVEFPSIINPCFVPPTATRTQATAHIGLHTLEDRLKNIDPGFHASQYSRLVQSESLTVPGDRQETQLVDGGLARLPSSRVTRMSNGLHEAAADETLSSAESRSISSNPASILTMTSPAGSDGALTPRPSKPRRPLSAYNLYFKDERLRLLQEKALSTSSSSSIANAVPQQPKSDPSEEGRGVGFAQMARVIGAKWRQINPEMRAKYESLAEEEQKRYNVQKRAYVRSQQAALEARRVRMEATVDDSVRQAYFEGFSTSKGGKRQK